MLRTRLLSRFARLGMLLACAAPLVFAAPALALRVGMGLTKPPYILESGRDGLEVEIAEQAFAAAGYRMTGLQFPPTRGLAMFRAGQLDALLSVDDGIGGEGFFSEPYIIYRNVATTLSSRNIRLRTIEDLSNYSVAAFQNANATLGTSFKAMAERHADYKEYPQQIIQNNLLFTRHVDVVVGDRLIFRYFSTLLNPKIDGNQAVTFHPIFPPNPRKVVFRDAQVRDSFNAGLKTIQSNGLYGAILKKYAGMSQL